jgi:hypothetical protein
MAPLPVIGNCVRIGMAWNAFQGVTPYNVFHILTATDDLSEIALAIGTAMEEATTDMWGPMATGQTCTQVDVTPLDGTTAMQTLDLGFVVQGANTGQTIPAVCCTVSFKTPQRGAQGRGRLYVGPCTEAAVENGMVLGTADVKTAWDAFNDELAATSIAGSLCVASYTHAEAYGVTSIVVREACSTQRRRQRQVQNA